METLLEELNEKGYNDFLKTLQIKEKQTVTTLGFGTVYLLADGFAAVERSNVGVNEVIMNSNSYCHLRKMDRDILDPEKDREKILQGIYASLWGAVIRISINMPDNTILFISESEHKIACLIEATPLIYKEELKLIELGKEFKDILQKAATKQKEIEHVLYEITKKRANE